MYHQKTGLKSFYNRVHGIIVFQIPADCNPVYLAGALSFQNDFETRLISLCLQ